MAALPVTPLPGPEVDIPTLRRWASQLPVEHRLALAPFCQQAAINRERLTRRDSLFVAMIAGRDGGASDLAKQIHADLSLYASTRWRYERDRATAIDQRHAIMHQILKLSGGKVITVRRLRCILSGKKLATKTRGNGQRSMR